MIWYKCIFIPILDFCILAKTLYENMFWVILSCFWHFTSIFHKITVLVLLIRQRNFTFFLELYCNYVMGNNNIYQEWKRNAVKQFETNGRLISLFNKGTVNITFISLRGQKCERHCTANWKILSKRWVCKLLNEGIIRTHAYLVHFTSQKYKPLLLP